MSLRAFLPEVQRALETKSHALVDVRSLDEFTGKVPAISLGDADIRRAGVGARRCLPSFRALLETSARQIDCQSVQHRQHCDRCNSSICKKVWPWVISARGSI
jgi:hypothetical protein